MRKFISYVVTVIIGLLIGVGAVVGAMYLFPNNSVVRTISEKNVNITDTGISESVDKVKDSVVVIETYQKNTLAGTGTGFVYDTDDKYGYIMTNHHVIEGAETINITYSDDTETTAKVVGSDEYADIAVLKVDKDTIKSVATIGKSTDVKVGDTVFTIGSPMGKNFRGTVTRGILSGKDRMVSVSINGSSADWIMNVMQTDAAINPGNSGGPLSGKISRPYIGVSMLNATSTMQLAYAGIRLDKDITEGVVVVDVEKNSAGSKAGLQSEDVIIKVGDNKVSDVAEFRYQLYSHKVGETISITVIRNGKTVDLKVKLGSK